MFHNNFKWGVSTASYQIEGGYDQDGKGLSIWDMFTREQGKIYNGDHGRIACDSYNRIEEDVKLLKELGVKCYRFSISWTRILPAGTGEVNLDGLAYYDRLVDLLIEQGIEPYVTLFHWDYPYELHKKGGWMNPDSPIWFEEFAQIVVSLLGNRVKHWMTLNEPQCFIGHGYCSGMHAPGHKYSNYDLIQMCHNVLLSHGRAARVIKELYPKAQVGFAFVAGVASPETNSPEDIKATKEYMFNCYEHVENQKSHPFVFDNDIWYDPILLGQYPDWVLRDYAAYLPSGKQLEEDMAVISSPVDFMAFNVYLGPTIKHSEKGFEKVKEGLGHKVTGFNWAVTEEVMYWGIKFFYERYKKPIYIAENGLSTKDWVALDGKVHDETRIDFLTRYLMNLEKAYMEGVDIRGYFQWSFLDNFEWAEGYRERFGLVHVDFETCERTPKESFYWYKDLISKG